MNEHSEAVIVLSKCTEVHKTYGIRAEKMAQSRWCFTWAFPIKEVAAKREGYDKARIRGNIDCSDDYPGCPYCGRKNYTLCSCGHISCTVLKNGIFFCDWCGAQGTIGDYNGEAITAGMDY